MTKLTKQGKTWEFKHTVYADSREEAVEAFMHTLAVKSDISNFSVMEVSE